MKAKLARRTVLKGAAVPLAGLPTVAGSSPAAAVEPSPEAARLLRDFLSAFEPYHEALHLDDPRADYDALYRAKAGPLQALREFEPKTLGDALAKFHGLYRDWTAGQEGPNVRVETIDYGEGEFVLNDLWRVTRGQS